jgi:hypothetical protein
MDGKKIMETISTDMRQKISSKIEGLRFTKNFRRS